MASNFDQQSGATIRIDQRCFVTDKLELLQRMNGKLRGKCIIQPALQYFLATLCDYHVKPEGRSRLGLRCANTPEVRQLLTDLAQAQMISPAAHLIDPNVILSALKEILAGFPGGVFCKICEEIDQLSPSSSLDMTVVYLHGLLDTLPRFLRQFSYLVCRSLRNMALQSAGSLIDSYTDLLLLFTPIFFPSSVSDLQRFLRAVRLTLIMIDHCDQVFPPWVYVDANDNSWCPIDDDDAFFHKISTSLVHLEASLDINENEGGQTLTSVVESLDDRLSPSPTNRLYYQFAYVGLM